MNTEQANQKIWIRTIFLTLGAGFIYTIISAIRNNYGIMLQSIIVNAGLTFASVSFILAVGQLVYGLVQPLFGILAIKKGNLTTLTAGITLTVLGLLLIPFSKSILTLMLFLGIILPAGTGALSFGVIMGTINPKLPKKALSTVSGIVNSCNGIGNILMSPIISSLIAAGGLIHGIFALAVPSVLMLPVAVLIGKKKKVPNTTVDVGEEKPAQENTGIKAMFASAFKNRTYIFLVIGFFTCGFHMALITNHLPTEFGSYGINSESVAYAFSVFGAATIIGCLFSGSMCNRFKMKNVLGFLYGTRPVTVLLFFLLPKNFITACIYTGLLGFSGASTVTPVSGTVNRVFGAKSLATLFGLVFLVHQIGSFFSAWLGGICFNATGSYTLIWIADILLSTFAAAISFAIKEPPLEQA